MNYRFQKSFLSLYVFRNLLKYERTLKKAKKNPQHWIEIQNKEIKKFARYIYDIPFYRERFDKANITPEDIKVREDFKKLPVLTKEEYRSWLMSETADKEKYKYWMNRQTTGSSGTPLDLYSLPTDRASEIANLFRCALLQDKGYNPFFDRVFSTMVPKPKPRKKFSIPYNGKMSSISEPEDLVYGYNKARPDFYYGNKTSVLMSAQYALNHNIQLHHPKCIASISEALDDNARQTINQAFGEGLLFDIYGCAETGNFAADRIDEPGKHVIWNDTHVINLLNEEKDADHPERLTGQLLLTSLIHHGFPLVNYLVGDTVEVITENGVPYITKICGRTNDVIKNSDGTSFKWMHVNRIMFGITDITQFRIIQKSYSDLVFVLAAHNISKERKKEIENLIHEKSLNIFGNIDSTTYKNILFEWCERIPPDPTGKIRILISEI